MDIPVGRSDYRRSVAKIPVFPLKNRFFEQNPVLNATEGFPANIARPRMKKFAEAGAGHVRKTFSEPGTFGGDCFVVSGTFLYRVGTDGTITTIGSLGSQIRGGVSMAATASIGEDGVPDYLFIADGGVLWVYMEDGAAIGHLSRSDVISNSEQVVIDGVYYTWTNGSVDTGSPAGTSGNPWLVALGASSAIALQNLFNAINGTGTPGTTYSTALTTHPTVAGYAYSTTDLYISARTPGSAGNAITTTETGTYLAWDSGTLTGGGSSSLRAVAVPGDLGAISVAHINSYIIVVPIQTEGYQGQFYWINPGEITIDPLDFATAERSPDAVNQVIVFSDRFWLCGQTTTEPWITTGNISAPMARFSGVLYDRGTWAGTAVKVKDSMIVVDEDGAVFQIAGGLKRISRPDIEERIRNAIQIEGI